MIWLHLLFAFAVIDTNRIEVLVGRDQARTDGGAYIIRAFALDQHEFVLGSSPQNEIEALLWYPSGKVYIRTKQGNTRLLGQGNPIPDFSTPTYSTNFYLPKDASLRVKKDFKFEKNQDVRTLIFKAVLSLKNQDDIFFESLQTQILKDRQWITP